MSKYAVMPLEDYQNVCDKIRSLVGGEPEIVSGVLEYKIEDVHTGGYTAGYTDGYVAGQGSGGDDGSYEQGFEEGYQDARQSFWHALQQGGNRTNYEAFFLGSYWTDESFKPIYDLKPSGNAKQMFYSTPITNFKQILIDCGVVFDTSKATYFTQMFQSSKVTHLPTIDMSSATNVTQFCGYAPVVEIEKIISHATIPWSNSFIQCTNLQEIRFEGEIGSNGLSFADSKNLSHDSLLSIINALKDFSAEGGTHTVTLGSTNLAKLSDTEKAQATEKGWNLAE